MFNSDLGDAGRRAGLIRAVWPVMRGLDTRPWPRRNHSAKCENDDLPGLLVFYYLRRGNAMMLLESHQPRLDHL